MMVFCCFWSNMEEYRGSEVFLSNDVTRRRAFLGRGNESLNNWSRSRGQDGRHAIYGKNL